MRDGRTTKRIMLGAVFAVVGTVGFYALGEASGGSGLGSAAIFFGIFAVFLLIRVFGSRSSRSDGEDGD